MTQSGTKTEGVKNWQVKINSQKAEEKKKNDNPLKFSTQIGDKFGLTDSAVNQRASVIKDMLNKDKIKGRISLAFPAGIASNGAATGVGAAWGCCVVEC